MQRFPIRRAALALAACAALGPGSARAMILPGAESKEAKAGLEAKAHQEGKALTSVVLVAVSTDPGSADVSYGTGTYLGPAKDGKTGLVLTAAHVLMGSGFERQEALTPALLFGPDGRAEDALTVPGSKVVIHPGLFKDEAMGAAVEGGPRVQVHHDLAVVEFDLAAHGKDLERLGVRPIPLCEGKDHQAPLLEARQAGFGPVGHAGGSELAESLRIHAGPTRVSYRQVEGHWGFQAWAPLKGWQAQWTHARNDDRQAACLDLEPKDLKFHRKGLGLVRVKPEARQVVGVGGDSGGPLLIPGPDQVPHLAGVFSCSGAEQMVDIRTGESQWLLRQYFVAVPDNLDWIRGVQAGQYGDSLVAADLTGTRSGGSETKAETKTETKA